MPRLYQLRWGTLRYPQQMSLVNNSQSTCRGTIDPVPQQSTAAASSDAPRSSKRDTEHEDSGGDSKRLHSEVADTQMPQ